MWRKQSCVPCRHMFFLAEMNSGTTLQARIVNVAIQKA
jgi:hypothetical protein